MNHRTQNLKEQLYSLSKKEKKNLSEFKEATKIHPNELKGKEREKKCLSDDKKRKKKPTKIRLKEMTETIQYLKMEFNKKIETLKITQAEMNMELKNPITQLEHSKKAL